MPIAPAAYPLITQILPIAIVSAVFSLLTAGIARGQETGQLTERQKIVHVLNRLGYGARPGDVDRVEAMGLEAYIRQQLYPEAIDDVRAVAAVAKFDTLSMSSSHLMDEMYGDIRRFVGMQMAAGNGADMKLRYGIDPNNVLSKPETQPAKPTTMPVAMDWTELAQRDGIRNISEFQKAKLVRAALSERQLNEVLVDFWSNHFNVDLRKNACRALLPAQERDAIRPHVLAKFRDLLGATAHSPAMLAYLDNNENSVVRERGMIERAVIEMYVGYKLGLSAKGLVGNKEGPNENYGREILELHTLGVDGGYTQKDVQEVARCFTGWTYDGSGKFEFQANRHDTNDKVVLGHVISAGGLKDGEQVLDILASHPSTAKFISRKLCQRFVADEPPAGLVDRVTAVFHASDGDLRKVVEAIVTSPEFFSPSAYRSKIKSPFEYAVSAVRATDGNFIDIQLPLQRKLLAVREGAAALGYGGEKLSAEKSKTLNMNVHDMGQPLYQFAAPTGYPEVSSKWVNPGALIDRLNFALALTQQNVTDVIIDPAKLLGKVDADEPQAVLESLAQMLLHDDMSASTRKTLTKAALPAEGEGKTVDVAKLTALLLGSPEFQRK